MTLILVEIGFVLLYRGWNSGRISSGPRNKFTEGLMLPQKKWRFTSNPENYEAVFKKIPK